MILLTVYLTGLVVCFLYDISLYVAEHDPYGGKGVLFAIFDLLMWPITIVMALGLAFLYREIKLNRVWSKNKRDAGWEE